MAQVLQTIVQHLEAGCILDSLAAYELPEKDCFLACLSKLIGYAIVVASTIVKLPQILIILRSKSVEGLSTTTFELELVGYVIALSYCLFNNLPFSAYGELLFMLIQAFVLVLLIYNFSNVNSSVVWIKAGLFSAIAPVLLGGKLDPKVYALLYTGQTALFTASRIPQIWENFSSGSTGQLSFATTFMNFAGCIARLFTYLQEQAPTSMILGSVLGMISHGTLLSQIVYYNFIKKKKANPPAKKND